MATPNRDRFWLVWRVGSVPHHEHRTLEAATAEAVRLARANPATAFYVMEAVRVATVRDVDLVDLSDGQDLPF